jgi:hypothetical protein
MASEAQNRAGAGAPSNEGFPLYRKTLDNKHYYRIEGIDRFTELQVVGSRIAEYHVLAVQYPERLRIVEMIQGAAGRYLAITEQEWLARR